LDVGHELFGKSFIYFKTIEEQKLINCEFICEPSSVS